MYNFSGIYYRIWAVWGILFLMGVVAILFVKPWSKKIFRIKDYIFGIICILFALCMSTICICKIIFPHVSSYTGEFIDTHRNSRVAPPLPFTSEYVFWNGEEKKQVFYLDSFSKKEIFPCELELGDTYVVYFDEFTNVIVKIEKP